MNTDYISKRLLEVLVLLSCYAMLYPFFGYIILSILPVDQSDVALQLQQWGVLHLGVSLIFASVLLGLGHVPKPASIYVFLLSTALPLYGGILYIIVTSLKMKKK